MHLECKDLMLISQHLEGPPWVTCWRADYCGSIKRSCASKGLEVLKSSAPGLPYQHCTWAWSPGTIVFLFPWCSHAENISHPGWKRWWESHITGSPQPSSGREGGRAAGLVEWGGASIQSKEAQFPFLGIEMWYWRKNLIRILLSSAILLEECKQRHSCRAEQWRPPDTMRAHEVICVSCLACVTGLAGPDTTPQ